MNRMIIDVQDGQVCIAITKENKLDHFFIERATGSEHYGNIYIGRVEQIKPGIQAAFVNIGEGKNGLLHQKDIHPNDENLPIEKCVKKGQELIVQVKKEAIGDKGPRLTTKCSLSGHFLVLLPMEKKVYISKKIRNTDEKNRLMKIAKNLKGQDYGLIVRTEAEGAEEENIKRELDYLLSKWKKVNPIEIAPKLLLRDSSIVGRMIRDYYNEEIDDIIVNGREILEELERYFSIYFLESVEKIKYIEQPYLLNYCGLEDQVNELFDRKVWLESGGYIVIDYTEACTVIDVNSGRFTGHNNMEETFLKINLEATEAIANQIRLRNIGGIIIIDYINIKKMEEQKTVVDYLEKCLEKDKLKTKIYGFTELCILQMTRKQQGKRLNRIQTEECKICVGTGYLPKQEVLFYKAMSIMERNKNLLKQNTLFLKVNPYLKELIVEKREKNEHNVVQMIEEYYKVKVQIEVSPFMEFGEIIIF
ncbi:ribonuclease G [Alkalibaculum bacchi]|uniref:Ribonuclease G n=2 Tax=Alkalibaculum bacchi TaxID=645887 RepID=A0A366IFZ4_9FIRM|nr:ribonuclease G [Alkalibaculum bacchi]